MNHGTTSFKDSANNRLASKEDTSSYLEKYRRRLSLRNRATGALDSLEANYLEQEIGARGDKLYQLFMLGADLDNIKIEEEGESQIMRN